MPRRLSTLPPQGGLCQHQRAQPDMQKGNAGPSSRSRAVRGYRASRSAISVAPAAMSRSPRGWQIPESIACGLPLPGGRHGCPSASERAAAPASHAGSLDPRDAWIVAERVVQRGLSRLDYWSSQLASGSACGRCSASTSASNCGDEASGPLPAPIPGKRPHARHAAIETRIDSAGDPSTTGVRFISCVILRADELVIVVDHGVVGVVQARRRSPQRAAWPRRTAPAPTGSQCGLRCR